MRIGSQRNFLPSPRVAESAIPGHFRRAEDGSLVVFALMLAVLMLMMGGIAVDIMRYETRRTSLQNALDRSTLAAAAWTQDLDPESVVDDYFLKAGLADYLTSVTVTQGLNFSSVTAEAEADAEPMFLNMLGIDKFEAPGIATAEQRINNVEVMLVLDVSYSMNSNNRLANLKVAAKKFVSDVLTNDVEHRISIGIVPFNGQVNLTPTLAARFNTVYPSGVTDINCIDLLDPVYDDSFMDETFQMSMTTGADPRSTTNTANAYTAYNNSSYATPSNISRSCPAVAGNVVRLPQQNIATLQSNINGLQSAGYTSIDAGIKWGLSLLDPHAQDLFADMITAGQMPSSAVGRPFEYDDREAMKVIVLMTDGENTADVRVVDSYKFGNSPIWRGTDNNYSIFHNSKVVSTDATTICNSRPYFVPHLGVWQSRPWNGTAPVNTACYDAAAVTPSTAVQTWPQVWASLRTSYVAWQFYARPLGGLGNTSTEIAARTTTYNVMMDTFLSSSIPSEMDANLQDICGLAKDNDVTIYGIAFEAPSVGQTAIRNCSTNPVEGSHYFTASGSGISTVFNAIASNISQLRLTQ
jgi:Flp pilus assembly protein TadG